MFFADTPWDMLQLKKKQWKPVITICILLLLIVLCSPSSHADDTTQKNATTFKSPVSAAESLKHFRLHSDVSLELVAAEPEVIDPVAIAFDEDGRMWVIEMSDYPNGPAKGEPPKSRIRLLEDRNGDGYYESATTFADKLLFATGVQPWRGGVIVTLAGRVAYFRDTNGDGRADIEETWFTGFAEGNPQLRANHPTFALDNHIYVANGLRGGDVIGTKKEWSSQTKPISISGRDFRFDPKDGTYEAVSGVGQFGLTFDDFGNRFICSNRNPCMHIVLENRYFKRNPFLAVGRVVDDVSIPGEKSRVYAISRTWTTSTLHAGQFTAACGVTNYRGDWLPKQFRGNSFTCEPTGNLVHRDVLTPKGATFTSKPGRRGVEFLATKDEWFRPVNMANGPDGALYIVDMYRAVIEHPQWVPVELKNRADNYYGNDRGRIYRVVPAAGSAKQRQRRRPRLSKASSTELVRLLEHPNAWHRETAARLIYERQDPSSVNVLEKIARNGKSPLARLHALWALDGLGKLSKKQLLEALNDPHPRVREQAVQLSEHQPVPHPQIDRKLTALLTTGDDRKLRFQAALSLGGSDRSLPDATQLARFAIAHADDSWVRKAVAGLLANNPHQFFERVFEQLAGSNGWTTPGVSALVNETAQLIGARMKKTEIENTLSLLATRHANFDPGKTNGLRVLFEALDGLGKGTGRRGKPLRQFIDTLPEKDKQGIRHVFQHAARLASSSREKHPLRRQAVSLLRHAKFKTAGPVLIELAGSESNQSLRLEAIGTLSTFEAANIGETLMNDFESQTPAVRRAILDAMLARTFRTRALLDEIEAGRIKLVELDPGRVKRLTGHGNKDIKQRAQKLLAAAIPADRKEVLSKYQKALSLKANANRGRAVFQKNCTACHRIGNLGVDVAPDIADSRVRTPAALLTDILDPNRAIDSNYFSYSVRTISGKVHTGIVASETASSITLRQQENKRVDILRQDIDEMRSNGVSLMPVGLEKNITVEQMADLISFIKNWRYLDGRVPIPLNQ